MSIASISQDLYINAALSELNKAPVTLEDVRVKLSELSRAGKQMDVKILITSFAPKLTDIKSEDIEAAMKAAERL